MDVDILAGVARTWPAALLYGLIAMIPKDEVSDQALGQRPITIIALSYRASSTARGRECSSWQAPARKMLACLLGSCLLGSDVVLE